MAVIHRKLIAVCLRVSSAAVGDDIPTPDDNPNNKKNETGTPEWISSYPCSGFLCCKISKANAQINNASRKEVRPFVTIKRQLCVLRFPYIPTPIYINIAHLESQVVLLGDFRGKYCPWVTFKEEIFFPGYFFSANSINFKVVPSPS